MCFKNEGINKETHDLYGKLLNIMVESCTTDEQKKILLTIDEMVGSMMGNSFDDGVTDAACDSARELIHKHKNGA